MTRRREVVRKIGRAARARGLDWSQAREGANHTVYDLDGLMVPIPRHSEIDNLLAEIIYRQCAEKLGKDWWRT